MLTILTCKLEVGTQTKVRVPYSGGYAYILIRVVTDFSIDKPTISLSRSRPVLKMFSFGTVFDAALILPRYSDIPQQTNTLRCKLPFWLTGKDSRGLVENRMICCGKAILGQIFRPFSLNKTTIHLK